MAPEDFIKLCRSNDWDKLKAFLASNIMNLSYKIVVSAVLGAHHPEENVRSSLGLAIWDKKLQNHLVPPQEAALNSHVDIFTFHAAYLLTTKILNDKIIAKDIKAYVTKNKEKLIEVLFLQELPQEISLQPAEFKKLSINLVKDFDHLISTEEASRLETLFQPTQPVIHSRIGKREIESIKTEVKTTEIVNIGGYGLRSQARKKRAKV